jgi:hypothetical protein
MRILCVGDIAISSQAGASWPAAGGFIPGNEARILFNWELPLGSSLNPSPRSSGPRLVSHPGSLEALKNWAPGFVALATNHILDAGAAGFSDSLAALHRAGFQTVGAGASTGEIQQPLIWETSEGKLAVVNWVFPETHPECGLVPGPNCWPGLPEAEAQIHSLKQQVDWVLVLAHWSDELFAFPRPEDRLLARELAMAGADIIVGHHPHVVRGLEMVGTCPVYYSLGNYYFSDFKDTRGNWIVQSAPLNQEGLGVLVEINRARGLSHQVLSFIQVDQQTLIDPQQRAARRYMRVSAPLSLNQEEYEQWYRRKRQRFDRWWGRWHFGVRRLGVRGLIAYGLRYFK